MRKQAKKLTLQRETLHRIGTPWLQAIRGEMQIADTGGVTCGGCPDGNTFFSCTALKEDCCISQA